MRLKLISCQVFCREMAAVLGLSESNVGVKLNRIKNQLTQTLKGNENEPQ